MRRRRSSRRALDAAPWAIAALTVLFFARPLLLGSTFYFRDLHLFFLPIKQLMADLWRAGVVPLWNPYLHGGMPLLGDPAAAGFYPTSLLYLLLPAVRALNVELAGHVVLAALAAYALARTLAISRPGAWTAALVYGLSGVTLSQLNLYGRLLAMPFLPLFLLALHRHLRGDGRRWLLLATIPIALQVCAGAPETVAITWGTALAWALAYPYPGRVVQRVAGVIAAGALGLLLGAAQLLPLLDLTRHSTRGGGLPFATFAAWSVPWRRLPELWVPAYLGRIDVLDARAYWGNAIVDEGFPYQPSLYFGIPALALAAAALASPSRGALPRRARTCLLALATVGLLVSLGRHLPGFALLYRALPPLRVFRFPEKLLLLAVLPVALTAGWSVHRIARGSAARVRRTTAIVAGCAALVCGGLCLAIAAGAMAGGLPRLLLARGEAAAAAHLTQVLLRATVIALAVPLALALRAWPPPRQALLLAAIVTADLLAAGRAVNPVTPERWFLRPPPALAAVRQATGDGRFFTTQQRAESLLAPPGADAAWAYRRDRFVFVDYLAASYRVPVVFHSDFHSLAPPRTVMLGRMVWRLPWERRLPLLSAAAVQSILMPPAGRPAGLEPAGVVDDPGGPALQLLRNLDAAPRFRWIGSWRAVPTPDEALHAMLGRGYDPRRHVVVEDRARRDQLRPCPQAASVSAREPTPNRALVTVTTACPGYLVVADSWSDGWRYRLDGSPVAPVHADVAFAAIALPAGEHRVERVYRPLSLVLGCALSALTLVAMAVAWWRSPPVARRTRGRSPRAAPPSPSVADAAPLP